MKRFLIALLTTTAILLLTVAGIIIYIDPFFHYHAPLSDYPYVVDNQLSMNPGLARHMDYDSILLGSSMTVAFNTGWFDEEMGLTTQKLSYNGGYPKDHANIMDIAFAAKGDSIKRVFLCLDEMTFSAGTSETKYPIPGYLYDNNPFNDVSYIFNKDVLLDYCIRPVFDRKDASDWDMIYKPWWQPEHYQKALVLMYFEPAEEITTDSSLEEYLASTEANLESNIITYIEEYPDTTFTCFFPPYSILYYYNAIRQNRVDSLFAKYDYLTKRLLEYPNVEIYYFQDNQDIIHALDNYADYTHYSPDICHSMLIDMSNGKNRIDADNYKQRLSSLRDYIESYPYERIWDDWYKDLDY